MADTQDQDPDSNGSDQAGAPELGLPPPTTPDEKIAALEADRNEIKDRMLRIAAEFENWKKRARKDQTDGEARAKEAVLKDMLDVVDNLERATSAYVNAENGRVDGAAVLKGVNLVLRLFQGKLERYGVRPFEVKGEPFDPRLHEAISKIPTDEVPPGNVAAEMQKGYRIGDKLLRPAIVAVAVSPKAEEVS